MRTIASLPAAELTEGSSDDLPIVGGGEFVNLRSQAGDVSQGPRRSTRPFVHDVECRAVQVPRWVLHGAHTIPPLEHADEGILHDLLGLLAVAGDQA